MTIKEIEEIINANIHGPITMTAMVETLRWLRAYRDVAIAETDGFLDVDKMAERRYQQLKNGHDS